MSTRKKKKTMSEDDKRIQEYREKINDSYYVESAIARIALLLSKNLVENALLKRK
jgi:hypothetical protein